MYYQLYELSHAAMQPYRAFADTMRLYFSNPLNPLSHTVYGRSMAAGAELFERTTRRYGKPSFGIEEAKVDFRTVPVIERVIWSKPFCDLIHFDRAVDPERRPDPKILIVAPMSGHYATLLRGTVETLLPTHEVYITDWTDARMVPLTEGRFDLDDYIDYVIEMIHAARPDVHVMAVCQPSVPVLAVSLMEARATRLAPGHDDADGRPDRHPRNPTAVNLLAEERASTGSASHVHHARCRSQARLLRDVYPGFLQLSGFMGMNLDRHLIAHKDFFMHLVKNDGDSAEKHREFYDEYLAVMDLTAEFYLQTVETVFVATTCPRAR
jgi:poly(3-hydroxybutyrate) depolymerase